MSQPNPNPTASASPPPSTSHVPIPVWSTKLTSDRQRKKKKKQFTTGGLGYVAKCEPIKEHVYDLGPTRAVDLREIG
jgi:hypothetical protein